MGVRIRITYDPEGDTLYIAFGQPRGARGYQISDQILSRLEPDGSAPVGLTVFNFMYHINSGRGIELRSVADDLATVLASRPISQFLQVCNYDDKLTAYLASRL